MTIFSGLSKWPCWGWDEAFCFRTQALVYKFWGLEFQVCNFTAVWLWANYLNALCLGFLIHKAHTVTVINSYGYYENKMNFYIIYIYSQIYTQYVSYIWCLIHTRSSINISYKAPDSCQRLTKYMLLFKAENQAEGSVTKYSTTGHPW